MSQLKKSPEQFKKLLEQVDLQDKAEYSQDEVKKLMSGPDPDTIRTSTTSAYAETLGAQSQASQQLSTKMSDLEMAIAAADQQRQAVVAYAVSELSEILDANSINAEIAYKLEEQLQAKKHNQLFQDWTPIDVTTLPRVPRYQLTSQPETRAALPNASNIHPVSAD